MPSTVSFPAITLLFLLILSNSSDSTPIPGLDSFLTQQYNLDPHAINDTLHILPSHLKPTLSHSLSSTVNRISSLLSLSLPVTLRVTLVGPTFTSTSTSLLSNFLSSSQTLSQFHVITPLDTSSHRLTLSHSLHVTASLSPPSLFNSFTSAVNSAVNSSLSSLRSSLTAVSYAVTDDVIAKYHRQSNHDLHTNSINIYIINLGSNSNSKRYAYSYGSLGDGSSAAYTKCLGTVWTGSERYLWIDLSAGPVDYGPDLSGDGLLPHGEFHPLAVFHGMPKGEKTVIANLASLVYSAYQSLIVPSFRIPVSYENSLVVQFIHINANDDHSSSSGFGLDWGAIEKNFVENVLFKDQSLSFKKYKIKALFFWA